MIYSLNLDFICLVCHTFLNKTDSGIFFTVSISNVGGQRSHARVSKANQGQVRGDGASERYSTALSSQVPIISSNV